MLLSQPSGLGPGTPRHLTCAALAALVLFTGKAARADYPVASHRYLADPSALAHGGRIYLYCSNDDDNLPPSSDDTGYAMASLVLVSTADLKNWTDHGEVLRVPRDAAWANLSWAPAVIERDGTFYLYFGNGGGGGIGVVTSSSPTGPFEDPKGSALVGWSTPGASGTDMWLFDPGAFIDHDGKGYLYFGGNGEANGRVIQLGADLVSVQGSASQLTIPYFFEAAWMHERNGIYYLSYSTNPTNGMRIDYMTSSNPSSGFVYGGVLAEQPPSNSNNNHASEVEFQGQWYHAYHNRFVANEAGLPTTYRRNVALERLDFEADGSIVPVTYTQDGLEQLAPLDPYVRVEAETFNAQQGVETEPCEAGGMNLSFLDDGDWVRVRGVDFGEGAEKFEARVASANAGGLIEVRLDAPDGSLAASCEVSGTGGWQDWADVTCDVTDAVGLHDVYLIFRGEGASVFNFDHWRFVPVGGFPAPGAGGSGPGGASGVGGSVGGTPTTSGGSEPDSGGPEGDAGCGCQTAGTGPKTLAAPLAALLAALFAGARARARRRLVGRSS